MLLRTAAVAALVAACGGHALAQSQPTKVHVGLSASFVAAGGGALWVTDHTAGRLVRVDPSSGSVKSRVAVPGYPFGIAYGAGSVWVGSRYQSRVTRISVKTNHRQARIRVGSAPYALAYGAGSVWVTNEGSGTISRISPRRNRVTRTIRVGGQPDGIALAFRSEEHTSELQSPCNLVCRLLLEKKKQKRMTRSRADCAPTRTAFTAAPATLPRPATLLATSPAVPLHDLQPVDTTAQPSPQTAII